MNGSAIVNISSAASATVLTSWKEIAHYLGKGVRTVQRWEQDFGLPVRRPFGSNKKAILARPRDLDAWIALRCSSRSEVAAAWAVDHPLMQDPTSRAYSSIGALSALNAQIATSRLLRSSNRALMLEINSALDQLRAELQTYATCR